MSKTDHPRLMGTHRAGRYDRCQDCYGPGCTWCNRAPEVLDKHEAIAEGLSERMYVEVDLDEPARDCESGWDEEPLADWERELLDVGPLADHEYLTLRRAEHEALEDEFGFDPFEDEDDWRTYATQEARDAALAEERAWIAEREAEYARTYGDPADEDLDSEEHPGAWLTGDPREFFDALGDAWVIEGPSVSEPSIRAAGYMRVYELARYVGKPAGDLVRDLRLQGEYVASHSAYVAMPVCRRVIDERFALTPEAMAEAQRQYDEMVRTQERLDDLRRRLTNPITGEVVRPPVPRPGAPRPRPGRNPFLSV